MPSSSSQKLKGSDALLVSYVSDLPGKDEDLFNLSSYPLLDLQDIQKFRLTEDVLAETLELMLTTSLPEELAQMQQFHDQGNWEKAQAMAHRIKGGCVYVGATRLKMACQYFERYWKIGHRELLDELYQQVLDTSHESAEHIQNWLDRRK